MTHPVRRCVQPPAEGVVRSRGCMDPGFQHTGLVKDIYEGIKIVDPLLFDSDRRVLCIPLLGDALQSILDSGDDIRDLGSYVLGLRKAESQQPTTSKLANGPQVWSN